MYSLQYWHETRAEWRGCGVYSQDREVVARRLLGMRAQCHDSVRFRVEYTPTLPTMSTVG